MVHLADVFGLWMGTVGWPVYCLSIAVLKNDPKLSDLKQHQAFITPTVSMGQSGLATVVVWLGVSCRICDQDVHWGCSQASLSEGLSMLEGSAHKLIHVGWCLLGGGLSSLPETPLRLLGYLHHPAVGLVILKSKMEATRFSPT